MPISSLEVGDNLVTLGLGLLEEEEEGRVERELRLDVVVVVEVDSHEIRGIDRPTRSRTDRKMKGPVNLED